MLIPLVVLFNHIIISPYTSSAVYLGATVINGHLSKGTFKRNYRRWYRYIRAAGISAFPKAISPVASPFNEMVMQPAA